ncbi:MAG: hypothetical protein ACRD19_05515 [Terriglobia bacterium]
MDFIDAPDDAFASEMEKIRVQSHYPGVPRDDISMHELRALIAMSGPHLAHWFQGKSQRAPSLETAR